MSLPVPVEQFGDTLRLSGAIFDDGKTSYLLYLPGKELDMAQLPPFVLTIEDWKQLVKQSDDPTFYEYEDETRGVVKAIVKKSERQVDSAIMWEVYRRAGFKCEYCGADNRPLTYDHYLAQAFGGQTTLENGVASCRPCNKKKGHMTVAEWEAFMAEKGFTGEKAKTSSAIHP